MKKIVLILVTLVLLVSGSFVLLKTYMPKINNKNAGNQSLKKSELQNSFSYQDLLNSNGVECSFTSNSAEGTIKAKNNQIRIETKSNINTSVTLYTGNSYYAWDPESKQGLQIESEQKSEELEEQKNKEINDISDYKLNCEEKNIDDNVFTIPQDINFFNFDPESISN